MLSLENSTLQEMFEKKRSTQRNKIETPSLNKDQRNEGDEVLVGSSINISVPRYNTATPLPRNRSESVQRYRAAYNAIGIKYEEENDYSYSPCSINGKQWFYNMIVINIDSYNAKTKDHMQLITQSPVLTHSIPATSSRLNLDGSKSHAVNKSLIKSPF